MFGIFSKNVSEIDRSNSITNNILEIESQIMKLSEYGDRIRHDKAYIFRYLMKPWFIELGGRYRHEQVRLKKINDDMLTYIKLINSYGLAWQVAVNSSDSVRGANAERDAKKYVIQMQLIENYFASEISSSALQALSIVRQNNYLKYSKKGDPAPHGYTYGFGDHLYPER